MGIERSPSISFLVAGAILAMGASCRSNDIQIIDLHGDLRDIWAGREVPETGKQADPNLSITVDFSTSVDPARVSGQFAPVDPKCGSPVAALVSESVLASIAWGTTSSDGARPSVPAPYNLLARKSISGVLKVAGPIAAGGDITLSDFAVNDGTSQPVALIAGGRVTLAKGSVRGDVSYGATGPTPQGVSISGKQSQLAFEVERAFQDLETLSRLLTKVPVNGGSVSNDGNLQLTGAKSGLNVFQVTADALKQAPSVQVTVPSGAGALINVSGTSVSIQNKRISLQGATAPGVLWNFPEARLVHISSVGIQGSVLAPKAWLSLDSASLNGTLVAQDFASSGSGSLQSAPLDESLMFGKLLPSAVTLRPAQALVPGCRYTFTILESMDLTDRRRLNKPLNVTFKVAGASSTRRMRELASVHTDQALKTVSRFKARPGINTPASDIWSRYASVLGSPTLVAQSSPRPDPLRATQELTYYQQFHQGYPVAEYGYQVATEAGAFRDAYGRIAPNLPGALPTPISQAAALQAALQHLKIQTPPRLTAPANNSPPTMALALVSHAIDPMNADDFKLLWEVDFDGTGIHDPIGIEVDAATGKIVGAFPGLVR